MPKTFTAVAMLFNFFWVHVGGQEAFGVDSNQFIAAIQRERDTTRISLIYLVLNNQPSLLLPVCQRISGGKSQKLKST